MKRRSVFRSDGYTFSSLTAAAQVLNSTPPAIWEAIQATKRGVYQSVCDFQFAYTGEEPAEWPVSKRGDVQPMHRNWIRPDAIKWVGSHWKVIPGMPDYEASIYGYVRKKGIFDSDQGALPRVYYQSTALVVLDGKCYSIPELLMLTFVGPKPFGYRLVKLSGVDNQLSNLAYMQTVRERRDNGKTETSNTS
jgi:hypothetical protein